MENERMMLRVISRSSDGEIREIREQEIPATDHEVRLFLRRAFVKDQIARSMLAGDSIVIERKNDPA